MACPPLLPLLSLMATFYTTSDVDIIGNFTFGLPKTTFYYEYLIILCFVNYIIATAFFSLGSSSYWRSATSREDFMNSQLPKLCESQKNSFFSDLDSLAKCRILTSKLLSFRILKYCFVILYPLLLLRSLLFSSWTFSKSLFLKVDYKELKVRICVHLSLCPEELSLKDDMSFFFYRKWSHFCFLSISSSR